MKRITSIISALSFALPALVLADSVDFGYLDSAITGGSQLLNQLVIFLFALAVVWFIWNVVRYVMSEDDDGKEKAKSQMIYGLIAIAVMASIWGIVALLRGMFGVDANNQIPTNINNMIPNAGN